MNRITNIITKARDTLADQTGDRWSTDRLIRLIDEAQNDICRRAKLLRTKHIIPIKNGVNTIELPNDLLLLDRVLYNGKLLPLKSHLELDIYSDDWESDEGTPEYLVYDKQSKYSAKLYPIPNSLDLDTYVFNSPGYTETIGTTIVGSGVLTDIEESNVDYIFIGSGYEEQIDSIINAKIDDFGIVTSISTDQDTAVNYYFQDDLGIITNISDNISSEVIYEFDGDLGITNNIIIELATGIRYVDNEPEYGITIDITDTIVSSMYGIVTDFNGATSTVVDSNPDFGIIANIDGLLQNINYGILTSLSQDNDKELYYEDNLGVTTRINEADNLLTVYYLKRPNIIESFDCILSLPEDYDIAIKYYITGKALRDDMDTQNRAAGNEELQFYDRELKEAISDDVKDFTRNNVQYIAQYQGGF